MLQREWGPKTHPLGTTPSTLTSLIPSTPGPSHPLPTPNHPATIGHARPHVNAPPSHTLNASPSTFFPCNPNHSPKTAFNRPVLCACSLSHARQHPGNLNGSPRYACTAAYTATPTRWLSEPSGTAPMMYDGRRTVEWQVGLVRVV